jgi:hypothetical protein
MAFKCFDLEVVGWFFRKAERIAWGGIVLPTLVK